MCKQIVGHLSDNNEDFERFSVENVTNDNANYLEVMALWINDDTDTGMYDRSDSDRSGTATEKCLMIMAQMFWVKIINTRWYMSHKTVQSISLFT